MRVSLYDYLFLFRAMTLDTLPPHAKEQVFKPCIERSKSATECAWFRFRHQLRCIGSWRVNHSRQLLQVLMCNKLVQLLCN